MVTVKDNRNGEVVQKITTPAIVTLSACAGFASPASYTFSFEKNGSIPSDVILEASMDNCYLLNFLFFPGCVIGFTIDASTGAMWQLPNFVNGNLASDSNHESQDSSLKQLQEIKDN